MGEGTSFQLLAAAIGSSLQLLSVSPRTNQQLNKADLKSSEPGRGLPGDSRYQRPQRTRLGSKREASIRNKPRHPLPPRLLRGNLEVSESSNRYSRASKRQSRNVLTRRGLPAAYREPRRRGAPLHSNPDSSTPGGSGLFAQSAPTSPSTVRTHTLGCEGEARGGKPCIPRGSPPESGRGEVGVPAPGGEGAAPQPRPPRRGASGSHEGRNPRDSPTGSSPSRTPHPRQDPRRNGNNEKPPPPPSPPRERPGVAAPSLLTPPRTHPPPGPGAAVSLPQPRRANARPSPPLPRPSPTRPPRSPAPAPVRGCASRGRSETQSLQD
ncbi:leucine-rich repeat extensin-like protein 5 [Sagmatias obliquidens]|uniref:leucine-rich repeat extensin-like protein 5 n=1 Tax=Sagmatias obliquidens TaxID=3371155 RepID=UPI000F440373|nr:leucine-rich repeat extensin-like protein 5 [Lagenorhynchus obliquidens]